MCWFTSRINLSVSGRKMFSDLLRAEIMMSKYLQKTVRIEEKNVKPLIVKTENGVKILGRWWPVLG